MQHALTLSTCTETPRLKDLLVLLNQHPSIQIFKPFMNGPYLSLSSTICINLIVRNPVILFNGLASFHHFPRGGEIRIYHTFASFKAGSVEGGSKKLQALLIFKPG